MRLLTKVVNEIKRSNMKTIKYHSQVGIITNSSTELFVIAGPPENLKEILQSIIDLHNLVNGGQLEYEDVFKELATYSKDKFNGDVAQIKSWRNEHGGSGWFWGYEKKENVGSTMLYGAESNSIPFWMWDLIESLGASSERFHLG